MFLVRVERKSYIGVVGMTNDKVIVDEVWVWIFNTGERVL